MFCAKGEGQFVEQLLIKAHVSHCLQALQARLLPCRVQEKYCELTLSPAWSTSIHPGASREPRPRISAGHRRFFNERLVLFDQFEPQGAVKCPWTGRAAGSDGDTLPTLRRDLPWEGSSFTRTESGDGSL